MEPQLFYLGFQLNRTMKNRYNGLSHRLMHTVRLGCGSMRFSKTVKLTVKLTVQALL